MSTQPLLQDDPDRDTPEALGAWLAKARLERGMEQREVATRLGLTLDIVRALESGGFRDIEAPVFVRGYVTRYARLLGLHEQEVLERYKRLGIDEHPPLRVAPSIKTRSRLGEVGRWFSYGLVLALVGWLSWLGFDQISQQFETGTASPIKPDAAGNTSIALPDLAGRPAPGEDKKAGTAGSSPATPVEPPAAPAAPPENKPADNAATGPDHAPAAPATPPPPAETAALASATPPAPAAALPGAATLVLEFSKDCWISVEDAAGKRLAYGVMKANTTSTFSGAAPFTIALGNSGVVTIKLNGQTVDPQIYVKRGGKSRFVLEAPKSTG